MMAPRGKLSRALLQVGDNVAARRIGTQDPRFRNVLSACLSAANGSGSAGGPQETAAQLAVRFSQASLNLGREEGARVGGEFVIDLPHPFLRIFAVAGRTVPDVRRAVCVMRFWSISACLLLGTLFFLS